MKYQKLERNGYNIHIINTDKFKTITVKIDFRRELKKEEVTLRNLLTNVLINSTKKYPNRKELEIKTEELYNLSININSTKSGNVGIISFTANFLDEKYTEPGMIKESIEFLKEIIFNPNIVNNEFDNSSFLLGKRIIKDDIEGIKDNPSTYATTRLLEEVNNESPNSYRVNGYIEDLDNISASYLYKYYLDVIENDTIDIFIIGNMDNDIVNEFDNISSKNNEKLDHFILENKKEEPKKVKEKMNVNQSNLRVAYTFSDLTDIELRYVLNLYSFILGGSGDSKLFKEVREKESLCYHISSSHNILTGMVIVSAGIDGNNYEKTLKLIEKQIDDMKKGNFDEEDLKNGKKITKNSYIELLDSPKSLINLYSSHEYMDSDLEEERMEKIDKVTKEDIIKLANKISLNTIFLLEGDTNE